MRSARRLHPSQRTPWPEPTASAMGHGTKSLRDSGGEAWLEHINQVRDRR